jgi:hypothetical protein
MALSRRSVLQGLIHTNNLTFRPCFCKRTFVQLGASSLYALIVLGLVVVTPFHRLLDTLVYEKILFSAVYRPKFDTSFYEIA